MANIQEKVLQDTKTAENKPLLFSPLTVRSVTFRNRIVVSPMCQYSSTDGFANDWHLVNLGSRAVGGAGLVFTEAAAVQAVGRISPQDLGIYRDEHIEGLRRITNFIKSQGGTAGIQLAHAGRKASTRRPWDKSGGPTVPPSEGGWQVVGPSDQPFSPTYPKPQTLTSAEIEQLVRDFAAAARRSLEAGFEVIELHAAHGYLLHQFLSPVSNTRTDEYGGSFENRTRLLREVVAAVREEWPKQLPLFVRISATDWLEYTNEPSWTLEESVQLAKVLREYDVDVIDVSSGGLSPDQKISVKPLYQVPFAHKIKEESGILTMAVGLITEPQEAEGILEEQQADLIAMARELLRDPYWPLHAQRELGANDAQPWPVQYERAKI